MATKDSSGKTEKQEKAAQKRRDAGMNILKTLVNPWPGMKLAGKVVTGNLPGALKDVMDATGKGIKDLVQVIFNHPEWYTHYDSSKMVNINLAMKQNIPTPQTFYKIGDGTVQYLGMPAFYKAVILLTTPSGDYEGWKTGIRLLYQQIRTANSGRVNFAVTDLEKYVSNVKLLRAVNAFIQRLYELTYTFRATNSQVPYTLIKLCGLDPDDVMLNAANIYAYAQRFAEMIRVSFPLDIDLYRREEWLFGNIFADDDAGKPSFIVTSFSKSWSYTGSTATVVQNGGQYYYTSSGFGANGAASWSQHNFLSAAGGLLSWSQFQSRCEQMRSKLTNDGVMSLIAGDIIKAFGDHAFATVRSTEIDRSAVIACDPYALCQFQNATVINTVTIGGHNEAGFDNLISASYYETGNDAGQWLEGALTDEMLPADLNVAADPNRFDVIIDGVVDQNLTERFNTYMYNWSEDTIDAGKLMSINRFVCSDVDIHATEDNDRATMEIGIFGTEVIVGLYGLAYYGPNAYASVGTSGQYYAVAGSLIGHSQGSSAANESVIVSQHVFYWANFDWAPRMRFLDGTETGGVDPTISIISSGPEILDWNVFAIAESSNISIYYSYANQSLVYAGVSQNQSNSKVYRNSSSKKNKSKSKKESRNENKTDKSDGVVPPDKH